MLNSLINICYEVDNAAYINIFSLIAFSLKRHFYLANNSTELKIQKYFNTSNTVIQVQKYPFQYSDWNNGEKVHKEYGTPVVVTGDVGTVLDW